MTQHTDKPRPNGKRPVHHRQARGLLRRLSRWGLGYDLTELSGDLAKLRTQIEATNGRLDRKKEDLERQKEDLERQKADLERQKAEFAALKEKFQEFRREQVEENRGSRETARTGKKLNKGYTEFKEAYQTFRREQVEKNRQLSERLDGFKAHTENLAKQDQRFERDLQLLRCVLESVHANPHVLWLFANRVERMDANLPIYDEARRRFHKARYEFAAERVAGKAVADISCGPGYGTALLVSAGNAARAVGVDIDEEAIGYAQAVYGGGNVEYLTADGQATGLEDDSFDVVVSFETIEHLPDDQALVAEFARLLRPGGQLIISTPNQWPLELAPFHVRVYDRPAFAAVLTPHFTVDVLYNQNSGTSSPFNHGQAEGIVECTPENENDAECYIAVCTLR